ncbi:McrC family protein [Haladaptatus sp. DYF46]|uniref:McrC family protein n=1 Tax=Haladaptatus sp. DYF46 TaxID=2886041 RepID=UPI001E4A9FEC|nr:McrC family protein [Haladaptatus sp. DYF46]
MTEITPVGYLGPPVDQVDADGTVPPSDPISLEEHDSTAPFEISREDAVFLESLEERCRANPLNVSFTSDGKAIIKTGSHVGVLTLPSGVQIEVTPKQTVTRLLWALKYAFDTPVDSLEFETEFTGASSFFDAIGVLFQAELQSVLAQGLHREYVRTNSVRDHVQGRIDVQRQLQLPAAVTTDFAVTHDDFTTDNLLNQAVLVATRILVTLARDDKLSSRLHHHEQRLQEFVSVEDVSPRDVDRLELSRLNDHYEALLGLTRLVLDREFFDDVRAGDRRSLALFVNMNDVFERIVERAFIAAAQELGDFTVEGQASIPNVVEGPHAVSMRPDVLITRSDGTPALVVDAKWKTGSASSSDVYQLTSYILALEVPGVLVYPGRDDRIAEESRVMSEYSLRSGALATNTGVGSYDDYAAAIESSALQFLKESAKQ